MATPKSISTIKSFRILRAFRRPGEVLTNAQVSRRSGLPPSSVRRLLLTLREIGAVERVGETRYRLGALMFSLGMGVSVQACLLDAAKGALADLHRRLGLPVSMGIFEGQMWRCLVALAPPGMRRSQPGARYEPYCSAIGRVLLAAMPDDRLEKFLGDDLIALTPFTITDAALFRAEIVRIRQTGLAVEREENCLGTGCLAVPICDEHGRVYAAIAASDAACSLTAARIATLAGELMATAAAIQRILFPPSGRQASSDPKPLRRAGQRETPLPAPQAARDAVLAP